MTTMSDLNFLNVLFDQENFLLNIDKDDYISKRIEKQEDEPNDWFGVSEETLNQVLPLFDSFIFNGGNEILQNTTSNECSSDSGLSSEQSLSPTRTTDVDDFQSADCEFLEDARSINSTAQSAADLKEEILSETETATLYVDETSFDAVEFVKEEVVEYEEIPISSLSDSNSTSEVYILRDDSQNDELAASPIVISYPESRPVKLLSNRGKRLRNGKRIRNIQLKRKLSDGYSSDKDGSDDSDFLYPRLQLTPEEQKLATKEGIKLPTHYPLSKAEERELKRIRRKIRNKISAQDSRRRKKEYVDNLEEKVKRTSEENAHLMKRIKTLESQKLTLAAQIRKLQATLARCSGQTAQPSTCLLVLIMSLALVLAPTLKNSTMTAENNNEDEGISLPEEPTKSPLESVRTSSRNLLFSHKAHEGQCNVEEETNAIAEQLQRMQIPDSNVLTGLLEMLKMKIGKESSLLLKDHDYFRPRKRQNSATAGGGGGDDAWLPSKMVKISSSDRETNTVILEKRVNKTGSARVQEPIVIDLLSD